MSAIFIHVSDIHFGQERDDRVHIHDDVKAQLIADAAREVRKLPGGAAHGILVTGDIAYSGTWEQYQAAAKWLDDLASAVGCEIFRIQMVPGNHDVDRNKLSMGGQHLIDVIRAGGAAEYEKILANKDDRSSLFSRFEDYGRFCEGYDCSLDAEGRYSTNMQVELSPGRTIRFVRLNSSILCTGSENEEEPELMVGARQFTIPISDGEETVVLVHHPMHWFKDSQDAQRYITSRARILISGHEHNPKVSVTSTGENEDFMTLAAGATVPFKSDEIYTFTYNLIEFDWDADNDALSVQVFPRAWNPIKTQFDADDVRLGEPVPRFVLGSPNFRRGAQTLTVETTEPSPDLGETDAAPTVEMVAAVDSEGDLPVAPATEGYRVVLLRFFRDLTEGERLRILVELGAMDGMPDLQMTQAVERRLLDWLVDNGRITEVEKMIAELMSGNRSGSTQ